MNMKLVEQALSGITVTNGEQSTVVITGDIPFEALEAERAAALKEIGKEVELDGFRKGHVPEKVLVARVGEMTLLTEMAERAIAKLYPLVIEKHNLDVVGRPAVHITKIAAGNPLGFTATVPVMPEITLPDFKAIAKEENKKKESVSVTDAELAEAIEGTQRQKLAYEKIQAKAKARAEAEKAAKDGLTLPTPETVAKDTAETDADDEKAPLPELTDEYVKGLGDFTDVADFKTKFKAHLEQQKKEEVTSKHRAAITDKIVEASTLTIPQVMIDAEIGQMFAQMQDDLTRANLTIHGYLEHMKKTREDLVKEWTPSAEKRAKLQLILNKIAETEKIEPEKNKVIHDVAHLMSHYKDADQARVKIYVESMLRNEAVMTMLESQ